VHPDHIVDTDATFLLRLWSAYRGRGRAGVVLPKAGGLMDQPAFIVHAFDLMEGVALQVEAGRRQREELKRR
ncbi:unnamed protein product, partial [Chrysoparadoxa australica]